MKRHLPKDIDSEFPMLPNLLFPKPKRLTPKKSKIGTQCEEHFNQTLVRLLEMLFQPIIIFLQQEPLLGRWGRRECGDIINDGFN